MSQLGVLREVGRSISIVRSPSNVASFMWIPDRRQRSLDPYSDFSFVAWLPIESGAVPGDLVIYDSEYYLVMARNKQEQFGESEYYRAVLYKCNSTVTIKVYNDATEKFDTTVGTGIHCLITQTPGMELEEDKTLVTATYHGRMQPFQVFMRTSEGLTNQSILTDQAGRNFRINKDFDLFIENGIVRAEVMWES